MGVLKEIKLSDSQVAEIKKFNAELVSLRNILREFTETDSSYSFNKLKEDLISSQIAYDSWFEDIRVANNIETRSENRWNVDFTAKVLQLLD